jgi:Tfp pilus assembly protein PilO
MNQIN